MSEKTIKLNAAKWICDDKDRPLMYTLSYYGKGGWLDSCIKIRKFHDHWLLLIGRPAAFSDMALHKTLDEAKLEGELYGEPLIKEALMRMALT